MIDKIMIALKVKFNLIKNKYFSKKANKKVNKLFNLYIKYIKYIYTKYYYIGFFSYKLTNYIILF